MGDKVRGLTKKFPDEFYLQKYSTLIRYINVVPFKVLPPPPTRIHFFQRRFHLIKQL